MFISYPTPRAFLQTPPCLLVVIDINVRLFPLASWDAALEHNVNLAVGSTLHLRQAKVSYDQTKQSRTAPDVATLPSNCTMLATVKSHYKVRTYDFHQWDLACTRRLFHVSFLAQVSVREEDLRKIQGISTM